VFDAPDLLSMRWEDVLFAHWPVDPDAVAATLPASLSVDTRDGQAWLGVIAFVMRDVGPRGVPVGLSFPELNLRTYVVHEDGRPGIYFYNLDADDRLGVPVARSLFGLPYYRAQMSVEREDGESVRFRSSRVHEGVSPAGFDATYAPAGEAFTPDSGSLAAFLTERYRFYAVGGDGLLPSVDLEGETVYAGDVAHDRWTLRDADAEIRRNDLFAAAGFDHPEGDPVCYYGAGLDVTAGSVQRR
jgi:uncharacterized protein YqjF (DUF2071 family)